MLTTMTNVDVLQEAYDFGELITSSDVFHKYIEAKKNLTLDKDAQVLIRQFADIKEKYEEVQRFGKYHPDFKQVTKDVREVKRMVDVHHSVVAFKQSEEELHQLLVEVSQIVAKAVSPQIKVPTGNPFFDSAGSCSGGCGSGGSCGCG